MPENIFEILFVDTSALKAAGFQNPDLQKLLERSKEHSLRIAVAEVAWEEWRTQMRDKECDKVREIRRRFDELKVGAPTHRFLGRLPPPALGLWGDADLDLLLRRESAIFSLAHPLRPLCGLPGT